MKPPRSLLRDPNLSVIFGITLLAVMGVSSIVPVFPSVARALGIAPEAVGLLITAFTLPGVILTPFLGALADRYGRKKILVPAILLFSIAGGACSLARDFELLLALRFLQGVGAASLGSLNVTLIGDLFSGRRRIEAMGYNASVLSIGTAVYPSLGGGLALLGWYVPFSLPLLGLGVALLVLIQLETVELGVGSGFRTYLREAWSGMRNRKVIGLFLSSMLTFIVLYGAYSTFIPLLLADRFGSTALAIGFIMTVGSLSTAITATRLRPLSHRFEGETLIVSAFALYVVAFLVIPSLPGHWWVALPVALFGVAQGLNYPVVMTLLAGIAPTEHRAIFMSVNGMVLRTGQTLGPIIMGGVFALGGMAWVFYSAAGICLGVFLTLPLMIRPGPSRSGGRRR
ncbi:MAG: MFS transporter [Longimicrobiales bacterium]